MAKEYTIKEFARLCGDIADGKVDRLCTNVVKEVGDVFLDEVIKRTPEHKGGYEFPEKWNGGGYSKSTTGLKKGWEANRNAQVSRGSNVYTMVLTNKAKSSYTSGYSGKSRTDYYAHFVDEGFTIKGGYKPILDARVPTSFKQGVKFTDNAINATDRKINSIVGKEVEKWFNEVF